MKVIILGAGRMGESVAEHLVSERNDITVIDENPELLAQLEARFDLRGIVGNGVHPDVLADAGARDADVLLACASSDAVNLAACKVAQQRFGVPRRVARLRATQWFDDEYQALLGSDGFAIDQAISPEASITRYVLKLVEFPEALQVREFARGLVALVSARATAGAPMVGQPLREFAHYLPNVPVQVAAIYRRFASEPDRFVPCRPTSVLLPGDEVFVLVERSHIREVLNAIHEPQPSVQRMMLAGGGNIGLHLARALQDRVHLKIIEHNRARCEQLATLLSDRVLILHGDSTDEDLLAEEGIAEVDFFCALTQDDENNIMAGLLAKQLGASRVLSLVNRRSYADLVHGTQIDIALSPAQAMMGELLAHLRQGDVRAVHSVRRGKAEAIEVAVHGQKGESRVVGRRLADIDMPPDTNIGLIVRNLPDMASALADAEHTPEPPPPQVLVATPDLVLQDGDHAIIFVPHRRVVKAVEQIFRVRPTFF